MQRVFNQNQKCKRDIYKGWIRGGCEVHIPLKNWNKSSYFGTKGLKWGPNS